NPNDWRSVPDERCAFLPGCHVEEEHPVVIVCGGEGFPIRTERNGRDPSPRLERLIQRRRSGERGWNRGRGLAEADHPEKSQSKKPKVSTSHVSCSPLRYYDRPLRSLRNHRGQQAQARVALARPTPE